jgi:serine/threonine-protein kinase RsbW
MSKVLDLPPQRTNGEPVARWRKHIIRTAREVGPLLARMVAAIRAAGFGQQHVFAVRLTVDEAVSNAIKHGHRGDPTKKVRVSYKVSPRGFRLRVRDEGPGFDPAAVADPRRAVNLEKEQGRGLFLMRSYMTRVRYNRRGNAVSFLLRRRSV